MIKVRKTINADTRTAEAEVTKEMLIKDTKSHIEDVKNGCEFLAKMLIEAGKKHDHTKIDYMDEFYDNFGFIDEKETIDLCSNHSGNYLG